MGSFSGSWNWRLLLMKDSICILPVLSNSGLTGAGDDNRGHNADAFGKAPGNKAREHLIIHRMNDNHSRSEW
jgi:hypothetical protein